MKKIVLGLAVVAMMISVVPSVSACHEYTPGYWKHNVRVYVEGQGDYAADIAEVKESDDSMLCYAALIISYHGFEMTPDGFLRWANEQFWMRGPGRQPIRQEIADWFNWAKSYV